MRLLRGLFVLATLPTYDGDTVQFFFACFHPWIQVSLQHGKLAGKDGHKPCSSQNLDHADVIRPLDPSVWVPACTGFLVSFQALVNPCCCFGLYIVLLGILCHRERPHDVREQQPHKANQPSEKT